MFFGRYRSKKVKRKEKRCQDKRVYIFLNQKEWFILQFCFVQNIRQLWDIIYFYFICVSFNYYNISENNCLYLNVFFILTYQNILYLKNLEVKGKFEYLILISYKSKNEKVEGCGSYILEVSIIE